MSSRLASIMSHMTSPNRSHLLLGSLLTALAATGLLVYVLELWRVPLSVPLGYWGDANWHHMIIKGLLEGGWFYSNGRLGAPFGLEMFDFPTADHFQLLVYKVIAILTGNDAALTANLGYLLGFPATAAVSFAVLRRLQVRPALAASVGILYAFLPYHFVRGPHHLFLAGYFAVPMAVLVVLRQLGDRPAFLSVNRAGDRSKRAWSWRDREGWLAAGSLVLVGMTGFYYAVFAGLFLFIFMLLRYWSDRDRRVALSSLFLCAILGMTVMVELVPTLIYQARNGLNEFAINRPYSDVELYALKPIQMLLPIPNHRIEPWQDPIFTATQTSEDPQSLGLIGAIGLVAIALRSLVRLANPKSRGWPHERTIDQLSMLTIGAILGASVGGFAAGFGLLGLTQIRAWNRISVYVGFFCLAVVALWVDGWSRRVRLGPVWVMMLAVVVVVLGVLDQTGPVSSEVDNARVAVWESDGALVERIEAALSPGAAVYQLPYVPFPEAPSPGRMVDYDHLRGYLHSNTLRWSYAGFKGRMPEWQRRLETVDASTLLRAVALMGFDGLYLDRFGYLDRELEAELTLVSGIEPVSSRDDRLAFYDLGEIAKHVRRETPVDIADSIITMLQMPPVQAAVDYEGLYGLESDGVTSWSWVGRRAQLVVENPSDSTRSVVLDAEFRTGYESPAEVVVEVGDLSQTVLASISTGSLHLQFDLPPGATKVSVTTNASRVEAPGDPRELYLQVRDLIVDDAAWLRFVESGLPLPVN